MKRPVLLLALIALGGLSAGAWWLQSGPLAAAGSPGASGPVAAGAAASAPRGGAGGGGGPIAVEVGEVRRETLIERVQAVGSLRAAQSVALRPEVGGRIVQLGFRDGEVVRRGQLLVQLDDSLPRAQLAQAEAQLAVARSNHQRNVELVAQGFVTRSVAEQTAATLAVAEAQRELARAELARLRLLAPFDGRTGLRKVDVGAVVAAGAELVALEDLRQMEVEFRLPERELARLRLGQPLSLRLDAQPQTAWSARILALEAQVDPEGRALAVRARLERTAPELRPGMFARVEIELGRREGALTVPEEALVPQNGQLYLVRVQPGADGQPGRSERLPVRSGWREAGRVEVIAPGLQAGDTIVTAGPARLMRADGLALRAVRIGAAARASGPGA